MDQRSQQWLEWRRTGIGASDVAAILGVSPYRTPFQVWEEKTKRAPGFSGNAATERGNRLEPAARAYFELHYDLEFMPMIATHPDYPFIRASLDGYSPENGGIVLEIKCPGEEDHKLAVAGIVPEKYVPQVQVQLACTGAELMRYGSYFPDAEPVKPKGVVVELRPDRAYQEKVLGVLVHFWREYVLKDIPPPLTEADARKLTDPFAVELFAKWRKAKLAFDAAKAEADALKVEILEGYPDAKIVCAGVSLTRGKRVDLRVIEEN